MRLLYALLLAPLLLLLASSAAPAYVYIPPSLGQLCKEANHIAVLRVEHFGAEKKALVFTRVRHLKGEFPTERLVQKFGKNYVDPHGELNPVAEAVVGQEAVVFERGGFGVLLVGRAWYQMYRDEKTPDKDWMPYMAGSDFWYAYWGDAAGLIPPSRTCSPARRSSSSAWWTAPATTTADPRRPRSTPACNASASIPGATAPISHCSLPPIHPPRRY